MPEAASDAGLYIFGIEWHPLSGIRELWTVGSHIYPDISSFADDYIRVRNIGDLQLSFDIIALKSIDRNKR